VKKCNYYKHGPEWGYGKTDLRLKFVCDDTQQATTTSFSAQQYDAGSGQWSMYELPDWSGLGVGPEAGLWYPGLNSDSQDMHIAIDVLAWMQNNGSYVITGAPEILYNYSFVNGICNDLPGVFASTTDLTWNSGASAGDAYGGWEGTWYTGDLYVCHESTITPEPATFLILALGGLLLRRGR